MPSDKEIRRFDSLRLIKAHEPIGSIQLLEKLREHGYSMSDRNVRLILEKLDEDGLTEKVSGQGRRLTEKGRKELEHGDIHSRHEKIRARVALLTSQVTYSPETDAGDIIPMEINVEQDSLGTAINYLQSLDESPIGPVQVSMKWDGGDDKVTIQIPSSITLDGVLLKAGIHVNLLIVGVVDFDPNPEAEELPYEAFAEELAEGAVYRYTDAMSGVDATIDVADLLIRGEYSDVTPIVEKGEMGRVVVDNREFPISQFDRVSGLTKRTKQMLGGIFDVRRPREQGPFPYREPSWYFGSLTYGGTGEASVALLSENEVLHSWSLASELVARSEFQNIQELNP